jgi:RNA polymerase sigma factor (sigma-70 family)
VLTWLLAITRNVAIDVLRLKRAQPIDPETLAAKLQLEQPENVTGEQAQIADRELLRGALADLPEEQRRALVLAGFLGRTAREIAELESVPLGTAKTRIRTAMIRLRETLEVTGGP